MPADLRSQARDGRKLCSIPKLLRQDLDAVVANLARRGFKLDRDRYLALESERKELQVRVEALRQTRNERSKDIGRAIASGGDVDALKREVGALGESLAADEARLTTLAAELDAFLAGLPNLLHDSVPAGADSDANVEVRRWGAPPSSPSSRRITLRLAKAWG